MLANLSYPEKKTIIISCISLLIFLLVALCRSSYSFPTEQYLGMHIMLELFGIAVSMAIAFQAWLTFPYTHSKRTLYLGAIFFCVGLLDLMHTLSFKGMPFFITESSVPKATWFWVAARITEAFFLWLVALKPGDTHAHLRLRYVYLISLIYFLLVSLIIINYESVLPYLVIEGQGVTNLKISLEYMVSVLHLGTVLMINNYYRQEKNLSYLTLINALIIILLGELVFTLYINVSDIYNLLGHVYKAVGYFFLLKSIYISTAEEPFFREIRAMTERRISEAHFKAVFNEARIGIFTETKEGIILKTNPVFQKMIRYTEDELCGMHWSEITHPADVDKNIQLYFELLDGKRDHYEIEKRYVRKDGQLIWAQLTVVRTRDSNTKLELIIAFVQDITEKKKIQKEMVRLDRLNLVGEMAAGVSHEVRNPMTIVRGYLEILKSKKDCSKYREYIDTMIEEIDRASSIITEFLSIGKNTPANLKMQSLNNIVNSLAPLIQADAVGQGKDVVIKTNDVPELLLNSKEIRQVILNLCRNGLEAMSKGGQLTISTYLEDGWVVLAVQDEGEGIKPEVLEKLGAPFFTTKANGTGLGLGICYKIAARHNATINIDTCSTGTTFYVRFRCFS